jgi:hypothetical protein
VKVSVLACSARCPTRRNTSAKINRDSVRFFPGDVSAPPAKLWCRPTMR